VSAATKQFLDTGSQVVANGRTYTVLQLLDINLLMCREDASGERTVLDLSQLGTPRVAKSIVAAQQRQLDLQSITNDDWLRAEFKRTQVKALWEQSSHGKSSYKDIAATAGVSIATLYRWAETYRASGCVLSSLLEEKRDGGRGHGRIDEAVERIISDYIANDYLSLQKPTPAAAAREIRRRCSNAKLPLPAVNTIRLRLGWVAEREHVKKRQGTAAAEDQFDKIEGSIPNANWPLAIVQMDHTLLPVMIVDDTHRKPIKRAWITLAIDVFSRVCLGLYLTLDPPSAMSAGMCVTHCMLPKNDWLDQRPTNGGKWPFFGTMDALHCDNAREFRGDMLSVACNEYDIDLILRPVKKPRYGAHIERLMGTVSEALKSLKGATFSGPEERGEYDADGNACLTLEELEKWLILMFTNYHCNVVHSGIGTTPEQRWREGLMGNKILPRRGLQPPPADTEKLRLDFLPFHERVINSYGVDIDGLNYFDDVLRPYIGRTQPDNPKRGVEYRFRRDPRDVSRIHFFEEATQRYYPVRSALPPLSIWELREVKRLAKERGFEKPDERQMFDILTEMRDIEDEAAAKTRAARSAQQQRAEHAKARDSSTSKPSTETPPEAPASPTAPPSAAPPREPEPAPVADAIKGYDPSTIRPIDDDE
jgi:putative transposase